jgi:hypothetical protein
VGELALLMVKKMWEMFCNRDKDGPRQLVTKDGSIMDNRLSVLSFTSRYNQFLFAPICEEANGMRLSVFSALARMDVDPWEEATRLAAMPKATAERTLVSTLDQVLGKSCHRSETEVIAARLVHFFHTEAKAGQLPQRRLQESARNGLIGWCGWVLR